MVNRLVQVMTTALVFSGARRAPEQPPGPQAKCQSDETDTGALEDEPGIRRQARPLDDGSPEMDERQEREKSSCGDEIGLHRIAGRSKTRARKD